MAGCSWPSQYRLFWSLGGIQDVELFLFSISRIKINAFARDEDRLLYGRDFDTHKPTGRFCNGRIPFVGNFYFLEFYQLLLFMFIVWLLRKWGNFTIKRELGYVFLDWSSLWRWENILAKRKEFHIWKPRNKARILPNPLFLASRILNKETTERGLYLLAFIIPIPPGRECTTWSKRS